MNKKIRRQGKLSVYEIHAARDGNTGENLHLCDQDIRADHLQGRKAARKPVNSAPPVVQVGDTVVIQEKQHKHKAREAFVVTGLEKEEVQAQKLLHPLEHGKVKFMSKVYSTDAKNVVVARRAQQSWSSPHLSQLPVPSPPVCSSPGYDPVNLCFWCDDDESDEDHEDVVLEQMHLLIVQERKKRKTWRMQMAIPLRRKKMKMALQMTRSLMQLRMAQRLMLRTARVKNRMTNHSQQGSLLLFSRAGPRGVM